MYTEIIKIIEGGMKNDQKKIVGYSKLLVDKLRKEGQEQLAKRIESIISVSKPVKDKMVSLNELASTPVDQESRLSIVDVTHPDQNDTRLILSSQIKHSIQNFIDGLKYRDQFHKVGIQSNHSLLLYGPPGSGKSSIAKYISCETNLPLVTARLDTIVSSLLGNTAKNIRRIFEFADQKPCILFLDEFDAIAKARDDHYEMGELKRVINSLLQNIDLFTKNNILIAATNHNELLDKAIWRRFNTVVEVGFLKNEGEIKDLIRLYLNGFKTNFLDDKKKSDALINEFRKHSPSDIKTICHNSIANQIIKGSESLNMESLLECIYSFDNHNNYENDGLIKFLSDNYVTQTEISEFLDISLRQVKNVLSNK
ncbi:MAG: ATP-binding protein [Cyclobacteriaceae bacterium]